MLLFLNQLTEGLLGQVEILLALARESGVFNDRPEPADAYTFAVVHAETGTVYASTYPNVADHNLGRLPRIGTVDVPRHTFH